ncbi:SnoaL-like domain protein [Phaeobacter piscinae]|uniref:SnoaL-like domain protein n=1 Tax=Phaeobacter piscinae TaxID=1580596 RepID=A0AAN1LAA4_9RHOB|nr:nuclear transport factor 2 family protein [Phaeobacter piscinae]ATG43229.1 SnoaL-like domain protein [Phaeobacter piscinae]AUR35547.1 SnoaL-like domain protein [Phaeobacter piscinae]
MKNSERLFQWFHDVWVSGNLDLVEPMFHPDLEVNGPLHGAIAIAADYREVVGTLGHIIHDLDLTLTHALDDGDLAAIRIQVRGYGRSEDFELHYSGQLIVRMQDGQIREFLSNFDYMTMFEQLGQLPPDCLPICMTGERLIWADET